MNDPNNKPAETEIEEPETPENDERNDIKEPDTDEEQKIEADHTTARAEKDGWKSDKIGEQSSYDSQTNVQKQIVDGEKGRTDISENDLHGVRNVDKDGNDLSDSSKEVGDYVADSGV